MSIFDMVNIDYNQIFNTVMKSDKAQGLMADFMNHCLLHCSETRECIIEILSKDERFDNLIDNALDRYMKKSKTKSEFFS